MKGKVYTFFIASGESGDVRRLRVPFYLLHVLAVLAVVGGITVVAAVGSYSRMLWKVTNYNALRRDQDTLQKQYQELQTVVKDTNQRLNSLQSLASEVAMTYGITRFRETPFGLAGTAIEPAESDYQQSVDQFDFLQRNATGVALASQGLRLLPGPKMGDVGFVPSIWPVIGEISGSFGQRMDPFSGEGAWHTGVDIASHYGDEVHASADGVIVFVDTRGGYGRLVVIDHGFGISTWYGHLSAFDTHVGTHVKRGEVIGLVGESGRATAPHVHYEVRINNTPVNPWRYLHGNTVTAAAD
jgi:murein DD-endopeptidase MepM/ murein hydrolase activator NlpD